jgi:hypothetical protein
MEKIREITRRNDEDFNRGGKEVFLFASKALGGG